MAAKYESSNYDNAAKKYEELRKKYSGEAGYTLAQKQASQTAAQAGQAAGAQAASSARAAGMNKAQAASTGANAGANATLNAYGSAHSAALSNNQNAINSAAQTMGYEQQKDQNKWQSKQNEYNAWLGGIGGAATGIASVLSDGNKKVLFDKTKSARCDELLAKLKGGK